MRKKKQWCVTSWRSGKQLWVHTDELRFRDEHGDGPRATPTIVDGRVYTLGGTGLLNCLDLTTGELIWAATSTHGAKEEQSAVGDVRITIGDGWSGCRHARWR